jgi:hypothetical protein
MNENSEICATVTLVRNAVRSAYPSFAMIHMKMNGLPMRTNTERIAAGSQFAAAAASSIWMPSETKKMAMKKLTSGCTRRRRSSA